MSDDTRKALFDQWLVVSGLVDLCFHQHPLPPPSPLPIRFPFDYYTSLTPPSLEQNLKLLGTGIERITRMLWCKPAPNCSKQDDVKSGLALTSISDISIKFHFELPVFFYPLSTTLFPASAVEFLSENLGA